jgi:hypothetical protein
MKKYKVDQNSNWDDDFERMKKKFEGKKNPNYKRKEKYKKDIFRDDKY